MVARRLISTDSPFEKQAGYSRAVMQGPWIFVSGTTGYDYETMQMPTDLAGQAHQCFRTIEQVLGEAGADLGDIVRARYIVTDARDADQFLTIAGFYLKDVRPAATLIVAGLLKPEMKIEIEVTALKRT